ncbi:unnamed protein product [Hyaloperonospora brassicae]|uniref:C2 domain-containing protein n=1 Tax=Hyaloperonospora brassicae TaxID=162125 RepID=A0AAV0UJY0_HYABA|nr:unnamed protein product [Hyaloperonospora brassicae]
MSMELHVRACSARNLLDKQTFGKQDPYCKLMLRRKSVRTRVHDNGHKTPVWNQVFVFPVADLQLDQLVIEVKDKNFTASTLIGECRLPVNMFVDGSVTDQWYPLHNGSKRAGEINLRVQLKGTSGPPVPTASTGKALQPPAAAEAYPSYPQQSGYSATQQYPSPYPVASYAVPAAAAATAASQPYPPQPYYQQQSHSPQYPLPPPAHYGQPPAAQYGQPPAPQYGQPPTAQYPGQAPAAQYPGQAPAPQYPGQSAYYPPPAVAGQAYGYPPPPAVAYAAAGPSGVVGQGGYPSDQRQQRHGSSHGGFSAGKLFGSGGSSGHGGFSAGKLFGSSGSSGHGGFSAGNLLGRGGSSGHGGKRGGGMSTGQMAMGVGAGVLGGMLLGEALEDVFD